MEGMEGMKELEFIDILDRYIAELDVIHNPRMTVYKLFKDNLLDKVAVRNHCLLLDFEVKLRQNGKSMCEIYEDLAFIYSISSERVRKICTNR